MDIVIRQAGICCEHTVLHRCRSRPLNPQPYNLNPKSLSGVAIGEADTYGNVSYLVSGPHPRTQYFTNGNGGSIQYGDGVTLGEFLYPNPKFLNPRYTW